MSDVVNCYFKGGPFDGRLSTFPREQLSPNREVLINGEAYYKILDGPVLAAFLKGAKCDSLSITMEYVPAAVNTQ